MDINITLIIQMLVFAAFVWFTMTFVWPPLSKAMEERQEKISDGIAAGERGRKELELAQTRIVQELREAKEKAVKIIDEANKQAAAIVDSAKHQAYEEQVKITKSGLEQLEQAKNKARLELKSQVVDLAIMAAERVLEKSLDQKSSELIVNKFLEEVSHG